MNNIIYCKDCRFCEKSSSWKWCESEGISPWRCIKGRGLDNYTNIVDLDDFCSSAKIKPTVLDRIKTIIDGWAVDDDEHELLNQIADIIDEEAENNES